MKLSEVVFRSAAQVAGVVGDADFTGLQQDSRLIRPGDAFVAVPGRTDAHAYLSDAREAGATVAFVYSPEGFARAGELGFAAALVEESVWPDQIWRIADTFFDHPTRELLTVGVTGTNGKTTTAWLVRDLLQSLGRRASYLGTLGLQTPLESRELNNTTPFAVELYNLLDEVRGTSDALAMEVSSHALDQRRSDGVEFDAVAFTNLTQDHLDYHGTMEAYEASKWRLMEALPQQTTKPTRRVINIDDPVGARWATRLPSFTVSQRGSADLVGLAESVRVDQLLLSLQFQGETIVSRVPLGGSYNVENTLVAAGIVLALGYPLTDVAEALARVRPVPGRFEPVPNELGLGILVDYAHTPDALEKLLAAVRPLTEGRVITVFGCGGDRDRSKRPRMARAASENSDLTVLTSDNPRTEDPVAILADVREGLVPGRESYEVVDRPEAIQLAVRLAQPGDVVVIAGKGHEDYQIIGRTKFPMDDRALARQAVEART